MNRTVLISGAGIAGPTLAYWLCRFGFTPMLIERAPELRTGGYIMDFWGAGFDVAERMQLIPQLRQADTTCARSELLMRGAGVSADFVQVGSAASFASAI